ncbi:PRC-barrel domain-containing protein [Vulgatibacter sp.]|uniref:PRC-barrel domain-containing protein n=1 Tax=Vulgatibacter sp. TaxID=1971226 RepID=UPI00356A7E82
MRLSDDDLHGRSVIAADGMAIGELSVFYFDSDTWQVQSCEVKLRKDAAERLGAERSMFRGPGTIEIPTRLIRSVGDAILLSVTIDELRQVLPSASEPAPAP